MILPPLPVRNSSRQIVFSDAIKLEMATALPRLVLILSLAACSGCKKYNHVLAERNHLELISVSCQLFHSSYKRFPASLEEEEFSDFMDDVSSDDEWGNRISYSRTASGFSLRSNGPDGRKGTEDDLLINYVHSAES